MLAARIGPMSFDEYLVWEAEQDEKWELVDGYPIRRSWRWAKDPAPGMAGGSYRHADIAANILTALRNRLRGGPCRAVGSDLRVDNAAGVVRYPDVLVDCTPVSNALIAPAPKVAFEVLSPSNTFRKQFELVEDYKVVTSLQQFVFAEQGQPALVFWTRAGSDWKVGGVEHLDSVLDLPSIGVQLPLAEIYEGLEFPLLNSDG